MVKQLQEKQVKPASKSFLTLGPTLHYSHANVRRCHFLSLLVYLAASLLISKLTTGVLFSIDLNGPWYLQRFLFHPLSIFEYPWQIPMLGMLMGILIAVPVLTSQLMSFRYSILFLLILAFVAKLPGMAVFLLIGSFATALRPLRFRSRYIAIVLCMSPILLYFAYFGGAKSNDNIQWALSFTPWLYGWLTAMVIAAVVLGIGHFTRYRPGLVWSTTALTLVGTVIMFQLTINFAELDYQLYIARNNPEEIVEFHDHSITEALNKTITDPASREYFQGLFYPTETIQLRTELKGEIQDRLVHQRWPEWFMVPDELKYQEKRQQLLRQYERFINPPKQWWKPAALHRAFMASGARIKRMPTALYYKALLSEYTPESQLLGAKEILRFYSDYPHRKALKIWYDLYIKFDDSPESLESRWRIAMHLAGQGRFTLAGNLAKEALEMIQERLLASAPIRQGRLGKAFAPPPESVITDFDLKKLRTRLLCLIELISEQNRTDSNASHERLAEFVILNRYQRTYPKKLDLLLSGMKKDDPLRDNVLLAKIMLIPDPLLRAEQLGELARKFAGTDAGINAKFELAALKVNFWKEQRKADSEEKSVVELLVQARGELAEFIEKHPESIFAEQAREKLENLPLN
ncbi:MAG: hypothetical protein GWO86_02630 [Planctomycetes bacterium]|nr:hypothetical protein [Planctomycetota bacterium]